MPMKTRLILVTGSSGMFAQDFLKVASQMRFELLALDRSQLDITNLGQVRETIGRFSPWAVVNGAAYTNVDKAETETSSAMAANAIGPRNLAIACEETGSCLLHISTDYVFDGTKEGRYEVWDDTNPINFYGKSKLWGERYITSLCRRFFIVRTSWLFGQHGKNFVRTMINLSKDSKPLRVVNDQWGSPTYTTDLAQACLSLLQTGAFGTYHVTNTGITNWYEFAVEIFRQIGISKPVIPIASEDFPTPAKRPRNSALDPYPLKETVRFLLPEWQDGLKRYLQELQ